MTYPFQNPELPLKERVKDLISRLTIDEKAGFIPTRNHEIERLGIPVWHIGAEGAHGFVDREGNNTTFPQTIGLAASWDRNLLRKVGTIASIEARCCYQKNGRKGGLSIWSPTIDLERDPRWGRTEEGYGEDPCLTSELSCAYIHGAQGDDPFYLRVSCGPKHFLANNNEKDRGTCSCSIPPRLLHEYYLVPFKNAVEKGKAVSLMTSYNEVNGIPMMMHPILRDVVKNEWGLDGHIVTDGGDFLATVMFHHYFDTHGQTLAAALKNGADSMTDNPEETINSVREALERGLLNEKELDEHLERILSIRFRFGHFDPPGCCPYDSINKEDLMKDEYREVSLEAVRKSIVLIQNNNNILPIRPNNAGTIAVMGPLSDELHLDWYTGHPTYGISPLEGLKVKYGNKLVYTDCRDIVSFSTDDGRPLVLIDMPLKTENEKNNDTSSKELKPAKKALAPGKHDEKASLFYMEDWGWGVRTFTDVETGLMLEGCYARADIPAPAQAGLPVPATALAKAIASFDDSEISITATAKNNLQWFGFTLFNIISQENGYVILRTHDGRRVAALETGKPVKQYDDPLLTKGELFKMKIERDGIAAASEAARKAEKVIFFVGNDPMINGREEIDRPSLNLPPRQEALINEVADVNKNTVLVLLSGYPYTIGEIAKKVSAIIWMAHGIAETGSGIADIISGAYSPAGRLPLTWYENEKQLPNIMEYDIVKSGTTYQYFKGNVLWSFGHGLSYSNFEYSQLLINKETAGENETVSISFNIKNTGSTDAEEVPQIYVIIIGSNYKRPLKTLKEFDRLFLKAGEEQTVEFILHVNDLKIWENYTAQMWLEDCYCSIMIGASSEEIKLSGGFKVNGEKFQPRKIISPVYAERFDDYENCYLHEKRGSAIAGVFNNKDGGWLCFKAMDFGEGRSRLSAIVCGGKEGSIELHLDAPDGMLAGTLEIPNTGDISFYPLSKDSYRRRSVWGYAEQNLKKITGVHDLYFVLYGKTALWSFEFYV